MKEKIATDSEVEEILSQYFDGGNSTTARKILSVNRALIYDECPANWWISGGSYIADGKIIFGGAGYARRSTVVTLGGDKPFTIEILATANLSQVCHRF